MMIRLYFDFDCTLCVRAYMRVCVCASEWICLCLWIWYIIYILLPLRDFFKVSCLLSKWCFLCDVNYFCYEHSMAGDIEKLANCVYFHKEYSKIVHFLRTWKPKESIVNQQNQMKSYIKMNENEYLRQKSMKTLP